MTDQPMPSKPLPKIVRTFTCERCTAQLKTDQEYKQHKIDHSLGKIADRKIDPVAGPIEEEIEPLKPITPPTPEEKAQAPWNKDGVKVISTPHGEVIEHDADKTIIPREPITLKYTYVGTCPSCSAPVDTIPLDVDIDKQKKFVVIAWCGSCKKNIQQRMVNKL